MTLIKWNNNGNIFNEIDRWFNQMNYSPSIRYESSSTWSPEFEISESDSMYTINCELPGVKKKNISLDITDGMLTISGERINKNNDNHFHARQLRYGKFSRSFYMPENAKEDAINANFHDGMLTLEIPKQEAPKPKAKKIAIK